MYRNYRRADALYNMGLQFGWHCPERYSRLPFAQPYSTVPLKPAGTAWFGLGHCTVDLTEGGGGRKVFSFGFTK